MDCLNKFVPTKLTSKRQNLPWLNKSLRKAIRKKARLYNRAKTSKRPDLWAKYKLQKRDTQRNLRRARVGNIAGPGFPTPGKPGKTRAGQECFSSQSGQ